MHDTALAGMLLVMNEPMIWIVIGLVLIIAFGPVLYLMPSPRDREIAKLRSRARQSGLVVEMINLPKVDAAPSERVSSGGKPRDASVQLAAYRYRLPRRHASSPVWRLLKSRQENHYLEGWTTLTPPEHVPPGVPDYWPRVGAIIDALPGGCRAVDADEEMVTWIGRETLRGESPDDVITGIRLGLEALAKLHASLPEALCEGMPAGLSAGLSGGTDEADSGTEATRQGKE